MGAIAALDTGDSQFFDHRDPAMVRLAGRTPLQLIRPAMNNNGTPAGAQCFASESERWLAC